MTRFHHCEGRSYSWLFLSFLTTYPPDTAHSRNYSLSVRTVSSTHGDWLRVWVWPLIFWAVYVLHRTSHSSSLVSPKEEPIMCDLYKLHMCFRLHWSSYENRGQTQQQSWEGWEEQGVYLSWLRGTGHLSKEEIGSFSPSPLLPLLYLSVRKYCISCVKHSKKYYNSGERKLMIAQKYFQDLLWTENRVTKVYVSYESTLKNKL